MHDVSQGARDNVLGFDGSAADDGNGGFFIESVFYKTSDNHGKTAKSHEDHECIEPHDGRPVRFIFRTVGVSRDNGKVARNSPAHEGNPGESRNTGSTGYAGYDLKWNAGFEQRATFFTAATENERVSTLKSDHIKPLTCLLDEKCVYLLLGNRHSARDFPDGDELRAILGLFEQALLDQSVMDDHRSHAQQGQTSDSDEFRVAGSGPHQIDRSCISVSHQRGLVVLRIDQRVRSFVQSDPGMSLLREDES